jgi:hypothetical protein
MVVAVNQGTANHEIPLFPRQSPSVLKREDITTHPITYPGKASTGDAEIALLK